LFSVSAFAGMADQDPLVRYVRQQFLEGSVPSPEMFKYETELDCLVYYAMRDVTGVDEVEVSVSMVGNLIRWNVAGPWFSGYARNVELTYSDYGLIAKIGQRPYSNWFPRERPTYLSVRLDPSGRFFVAEVLATIEPLNFEARNEFVGRYSQAVTYQGGYAVSYLMCR
jgi:hypothetical protein